jgi:hypothetical protein
MPKKDEQRQQLILDALATKGGVDRGPVDYGLQPWEQLATHLTPLIGEAGFCALYGRAVRMISSRHKWLSVPRSPQTVASLLGTLKENFESVEPLIAGQANISLLDTYTGLLSTLIGELLTTRILTSAWTDESEGKNTQEKSK